MLRLPLRSYLQSSSKVLRFRESNYHSRSIPSSTMHSFPRITAVNRNHVVCNLAAVPVKRSSLYFDAVRMISFRSRNHTGGSSNHAGGMLSKLNPIVSSSSNGGSSDLPPHVRDHVTRTYALLASGVLVAACGSGLMIFTPLASSIPPFVPMVGAFIPLLWLSFAPPANPNLKLALFFSFCFLEGMAIAPIVWMSAAKGTLFTALFLTFAVFAGFTAAALLSPQGSLLMFQGPLFGLLLGFVGISLLNMIWPSRFVHSILLYGGLALFSALIAVDTQAMIERARCGAGDHVQDAMGLFVNMINIFVRIAQILRGD